MTISWLEPKDSQDWVNRAMSAMYRRIAACPGYSYPGEARVLRQDHAKGPRDYVVLTNRHGIVGLYRVQHLTDGSNRLKWIDRVPKEISNFVASVSGDKRA